LKNMKRPTAAAQGASPQGSYPKGSQPKSPQPKSSQPKSSQPKNPQPKNPHIKREPQTVKLQTVKTFKQLASRLAGFKLPASAGKPVKAPSTSIEATPAVNSSATPLANLSANSSGNITIPSLPFIKDSKGSRIAFNLLLVRPWVLVVGFWLLSMAGASLAIEGLVNPRKLNMALPEATVEVTPVAKSTLIDVAQDSEVTTGEATTAATKTASSEMKGDLASPEATDAKANAKESQDASAETVASSSGFPILTLGALVGTCAAGCLVISRRRAMMRIAAARARGKMRRAHAKKEAIAQVTSPVAMSDQALTAASPNKKRRQRNKRQLATSSQPTTNMIVSRSTAQQAAQKSVAQKSAAPKPAQKAVPKPGPKSGQAPSKRQIRRTPSRIASRRQSVVSVLPASESHALDWANGSLAHQMDVRPQRTASM
jgi:hypothetical protein